MQIFKDALWFFKNLTEKKELILELTKRELHAQYTGAVLGPLWLFLEPISFICILWFVFSIGIRGGEQNDVPFIVFLSTGIVAWTFFSNNFISNTSIVRNYAFLVRKVDFSLNILPIVKILSSLISHAVLIIFVIIIAMYNKSFSGSYIIQTLYYLFSLVSLLLGLGWLTSAMNILIKDTSKVVGVLAQFGFWVTPVIWNPDRLPKRFLMIAKLNPLFYIVEGYRDSIIYGIPFWLKPYYTLYYWFVVFIIFVIGAVVFKRLRPHFAALI